jgi:hypothetical protein
MTLPKALAVTDRAAWAMNASAVLSKLEFSSVEVILIELEGLHNKDFNDIPDALCDDLPDGLPNIVLGIEFDADAFFFCSCFGVWHLEMS